MATVSMMPRPDAPTSNPVKKLECRFCSKAYSKAEHLTRHERSHTGVRPFTCKVCKRAFSRQDSLARHEKLHMRRESLKDDPSPTPSALRNDGRPNLPTPDQTNDSASHGTASVHGDSASNADWFSQPSTNQEISMMDMPHPADLDFQLIWPDSEDLYHNIMSNDPAHWQGPLGTLPMDPGMAPAPYPAFGSPESFDDRGSSIADIPANGGSQAVHGVSRMITNLSSSITAEVDASSITSVFLDESLHMFFIRFIPTFPVYHKATFVFRETAPPLLLAAMAIGSLYLGPKDACAKGEALWRLAHTAIATSWQGLISHRGPYDATKGLQLVCAALLGQVYAALSKSRALRTTSQIFHLGFFWARHCGMFDTEPYDWEQLPPPDASPEQKECQWRIWASREVQRRVLLAHYILDGQIAQMSGDPTSTRHAANQLGLPSSDAAFDASNADEWLIHMRAQKQHQMQITNITFRAIFRSLFSPTGARQPYDNLSAFSLRVILEGLQSLVSDCDDQDGAAVGVPSRREVREALAKVHESITGNMSLSASDMLETLLRWHGICLDAATDSSMLCRHICTRYNVTQHVLGSGKGTKEALDLAQWAKTPDARRALLHAVAIQDIVEQLPRGRAHVIHMPTSLFAAATVYSAFSLAGFSTIHLPRMVDWKDALFKEIDPCVILGDMSGSASMSSDTRRFVQGEQLTLGLSSTSRNLLYELNSMQKLFRCLCSQWGVAYEMEHVVDQWISLSH